MPKPRLLRSRLSLTQAKIVHRKVSLGRRDCRLAVEVPISNPHYVENTDDSDLVPLEMFRTGEYQDVSLAEWMTHTPHLLMEQHLGAGDAGWHPQRGGRDPAGVGRAPLRSRLGRRHPGRCEEHGKQEDVSKASGDTLLYGHLKLLSHLRSTRPKAELPF